LQRNVSIGTTKPELTGLLNTNYFYRWT
jgi:hypothetical protein